MIQREVFADVVARFERAGVRYMLCGSLGAMYYGKPRQTLDLDFVIAFPPSRVAEFCNAFPADRYYCPPGEVVLEELRRSGQLNLLHQESGVKIDCMFLKLDPFNRTEFERRRLVELTQGLRTYVASPEDLTIAKLQYYQMGRSDKHLEDIRGMLQVSPDEIDLAYIETWVKELRLDSEWNLVKPQ